MANVTLSPLYDGQDYHGFDNGQVVEEVPFQFTTGQRVLLAAAYVLTLAVVLPGIAFRHSDSAEIVLVVVLPIVLVSSAVQTMCGQFPDTSLIPHYSRLLHHSRSSF